jgi:ribonucleoside-diphosphate reductase alpha chain
MLNINDSNSRIDFIDQSGDAWQEFTVFHPKLSNWMQICGKEDIKESPYWGSTATEIDWGKRISIQSVVQKYTTHSISSTINLSHDVTEELVGNIYLQAWKQGLKGITVYRDGSRNGVLIANDAAAKKEKTLSAQSTAPPRPKTLEASVVRFLNGDEKWIAYVGLLEDRPYEIFTGKAEDAFSIPSWVESGWIIKSKNAASKSRYDFQYMDHEGYRTTIEGLSRSFNKEFWNYAKLLSGVLRHGMPLQHVVHLVANLHLHDQHINCWKAGVERALKKFIPDGTKAVDRKCGDCGDPEGLIYEEGCLKCKSCGSSKCG